MIIKLNCKSDIPIYMQLRNQIVMGIGHGDMKPGARLPTVRQLAEDSGVNAMTVNKTYALLKNEGFILIDRRHGAVVNDNISKTAETKEKLENDLEVIISEAGLKGVNKNEFIEMCSRIYNGMNGIKAASDSSSLQTT